MEIVSGFDAKEYHHGSFRDFFAPIGLGVSTSNLDKFKTEYERLWRDIFSDNELQQRKKVYCSRDLEDIASDKKYALELAFVEGIRGELLETNLFFTIIPSKKPIYSRGWDKELNALKYMKKLTGQYAYLCAWKQLQEWRKTGNKFAPFIDEFDGEQTLAWGALSKAKPYIFYRGDMSNPLIATADVILDFLDIRLRSRKLQDKVIVEELKNAELSGNKQYIGIPDLHSITPISDRPIDKEPFRARPVYYLLFEDKPTEFTKEEWIEAKLNSGMFYFAIKEAFKNNGCIKLYDKTCDYKFLSPRDYFIWCGDKGKEIVDAVGKPNGTKNLFYSGQSGV